MKSLFMASAPGSSLIGGKLSIGQSECLKINVALIGAENVFKGTRLGFETVIEVSKP